MYYYDLFVIYLLIKIISSQNPQCSLLNSKLTKYGINLNIPKEFLGLKLCQGLIIDNCCPQIYEDRIQNATTIELYRLFELYSINLYEPLLRLTIDFNDTIVKLIESSRNETHLVLERNSKRFYNSYRSTIDLFFNHLLTNTYRNYRHNIKNNIEEFFRNILRISIVNKPILPSYLTCLWRNHPFGNRPNLIANQLEINLGKLFQLNELLKLSVELVQIMSMSVTIDNHCIDSYMQLSYCNLCSGRQELPCLSNCENVIESCLVNITLVNDAWMNFINSIENVAYFNDIEKVLSSIGTSISDALMTFLNSNGIQNKDIINQCGHTRIRREIFDNDQKFHYQYSNTLSLLDRQLMSMRETLKFYRSFWLMLPKQICTSNGLSALNDTTCWTGTSISSDGRQPVRPNYDKPLSLRLQWILKEMREKSNIIGNMQQITTVINTSTTTTIKSSSLIDELKLNVTDDLDDYPHDNEFDYSDYAYEDSLDGFPLTTRSSTVKSSSMSVYEDMSFDDTNTVSYYDYGEQDVYIDDEIDETTTQKLPSVSTTTIIFHIPPYHRQRPVIWNINENNDEEPQTNSSFFSLLFLCIIILTNFHFNIIFDFYFSI